MSRPLFRPTPRQAASLAAIAVASLTYGFFIRYQVIEQSAVGIACESNGANWLCANRRTAIALFTPEVFGIVALGAALLNLLRPSVIFWGSRCSRAAPASCSTTPRCRRSPWQY